eukprot:33655-Hanusia_phi.AAC.2
MDDNGDEGPLERDPRNGLVVQTEEEELLHQPHHGLLVAVHGPAELPHPLEPHGYDESISSSSSSSSIHCPQTVIPPCPERPCRPVQLDEPPAGELEPLPELHVDGEVEHGVERVRAGEADEGEADEGAEPLGVGNMVDITVDLVTPAAVPADGGGELLGVVDQPGDVLHGDAGGRDHLADEVEELGRVHGDLRACGG